MPYTETIQFIKDLYKSDDFIPLHAPVFIGNDREYVLDTIDSTFVSSVGKYVDRFEDMMKDYTGAKYAIATVNGTAALHMALHLAGVKNGDIVITQALSFIATCNAISYLGAEPAFIDVDADRMGMSAEALRIFLQQVEFRNGEPIHLPTGKRIGACVPMHTFGFPSEIDELVKLCDTFNIPVVEDAAESLGSFYKNQHTGTFGKLGVFSFNGNKTITCGGGGIIVTNDEKLAKLGKHLTTQAKIPHAWEYEHDYIGYNYRCPNLNAALACAQLEKLNDILENKRQTAQEYASFFNQSAIEYVSEPESSRSNYWLNTIKLKNREERDKFLELTNENKVMTRPIWKLMTKLEMFKNCYHENLEISNHLEDVVVNIPSSYRE